MSTADKKILNNYLGLLERLNPTMKLNIIERLKESVKTHKSPTTKHKSSFGAWKSNDSADKLIDSLRNSRNTNRHIEGL